jgi:hypothetical protein
MVYGMIWYMIGTWYGVDVHGWRGYIVRGERSRCKREKGVGYIYLRKILQSNPCGKGLIHQFDVLNYYYYICIERGGSQELCTDLKIKLLLLLLLLLL